MPNQELEDILTSLQEIVRKAYALGRSDALKHVIEVMQAEETRKPLAITGPAAAPDPVPDPVSPAEGEMRVYATTSDAPDAGESEEDKPWWARTKRGTPTRPVRELRAVR